jgi:hypothetical protein
MNSTAAARTIRGNSLNYGYPAVFGPVFLSDGCLIAANISDNSVSVL